MGPTEMGSKRKNTSTPPDGYVCRLCGVAGHWIQQCPERQNRGRRKRKKKSSDHVPVPGVDPSSADIGAAREMQRIPPPRCKCGERSRLKKVKKSKMDEKSRANGRYFFFCAKPRDQSCGFARAVEDQVKKDRRRQGGKDSGVRKKAGGTGSLAGESTQKRVESRSDSSSRRSGSPEVEVDSPENEVVADGNSCKRGEAEKTAQENYSASDYKSSSSSADDTESSSDRGKSDDTSSDASSSSNSVSESNTDEDDQVF